MGVGVYPGLAMEGGKVALGGGAVAEGGEGAPGWWGSYHSSTILSHSTTLQPTLTISHSNSKLFLQQLFPTNQPTFVKSLLSPSHNFLYSPFDLLSHTSRFYK